MKVNEIKDSDNEVIFRFVQPENDLEHRVMGLLYKYIVSEQVAKEPNFHDWFYGKVALQYHPEKDDVVPAFISLPRPEEQNEPISRTTEEQVQG